MALLCMGTSLARAQGNEPQTTDLLSAEKEEKPWAKWSGEYGFLGYKESKGRVQALEPAMLLNADLGGDRVWSTKLVFDSLTGASPNGALNSSQPQTFTSPSGKAAYVTSPGEQPLYNQFKDSRVNLSTTWSAPISRLSKYSVGFNGSTEYDYISLGVNTSLTTESEDKNSSWTVGASYTGDTVNPVGGVPIPGATMTAPGVGNTRQGSSETKATYDLLLGFTQVLTRSWIIQTNLSLGFSQGYMNDPYKVVTVYEDSNAPTLGNPLSYVYESRPDKRVKTSVYVGSKNAFDFGYLNTSYRYLTDDWGLNSHTVEASLNFGVTQKWRLEPGIRYYQQSAVDFYKLAIGSSQVQAEHTTADYRLGDLTTISPGIKIIRKLENDKELSFILRYYQQTGSTSSFTPVGSQIGQDLIPKTDAFIVQVNYSF